MAVEKCESKLTGAFRKKCGHAPKQGIDKKWYLNRDEIDYEATQLANRGTTITTLVLKPEAKLYPAEAPKSSNKQVVHALSVGDFSNGYIHTDTFIVTNQGINESERVQELVDGAKVVTINKKTEGTYIVAGFESGMSITNDDYDSNANSGTATLTVATEEGQEEGTRVKNLVMTDIETFITTNEFTEAEPGA